MVVWAGLTFLYNTGPRVGIVLAGYVFSFFSVFFQFPLFLLNLIIRGFTFVIGVINTVARPFFVNGTAWIQSTFKTTDRIQQGIKYLVRNVASVFESKNPILKFIFKFAALCGNFILDSILAVYKAIPHFCFFAFLIYIWFFTGYPLMFLAAFPQSVSDDVNVYVIGGQTYLNIFISIYNGFAFTMNICSPFFLNTLSFFAQAIVILADFAFDSFTFTNTQSVGGGPRATSEVFPGRELADKFSEPFTQSTPFYNIFRQETFQYDEGLALAERAVLFRESKYVIKAYSATTVLIFVAEILAKFFAIFFQPIISAIAGGGDTAGCCLGSDPTAKAFAYCLGDLVVSFLTFILKLFGISFPGFEESLRDALLIKEVGGTVPCQCHKIIKVVPPCSPATYRCIYDNTGEIATYSEYKVTQKSVDNIQNELLSTGTQESLACPNTVRLKIKSVNVADVPRNARSLRVQCQQRCHKKKWLVEICEDGVTYLGGCDFSPVKDYKKEIIEFLQTKPNFLTHSQQQVLLHYKPATPEKDTSKPVYIPGVREEDQEIKGVFDFDKFKKFVETLEKIPIEGCPETFEYSFEGGMYRFFCLAIRFYKNSPPDIFKDAMMQIPTHIQHIGDHRKLAEEHIKWYKETTNTDSSLTYLNETFEHILTNLTVQFHLSKIRQEIYEKRKRTGRVLDTTDPVLSQYPACEYKCPAGECVKRTEIQSCTVPTNWTLGVTTRYVAYITTATFETFDFQFLFESVLSCWKELLENPSKNPATLRGFLEYLIGSDMSSYSYCFPMYKRFEYLPLANFNWNKYINTLCSPNKEFKGQSAISQCACVQYTTIDVFNYAAWSTVFTPVFVTSRLFNAWKAIQWLLVQLPIGWFNSLWKGFAIWANPQLSFEIIYAFDYNFALSGQSVDKNWYCAALHAGEVSFFLIMAYLLWILAGYLGEIMFTFFFGLLLLIIVNPVNHMLTKVTIYLFTTSVVEGKKSKLKLSYEKSLTV